MNTNQLKKFAQAARVKLIEQVSAKLDYVLTHDTAELRGKAETVRKLKDEINSIGKPALIDKVAYTWFNRFIALRFMDANGFQPLGYSVVTAQHNHVSPQILDEAHAGHISEELVVDKQVVIDLLDGRVPSGNPDNDAYRLLLVASCNHLSSVLPFLFERINDYTELLLPDDLTSDFSIVKDVVEGMSNEDCEEVEIIGWLYQFYISERKDEIFASNAAVSKEDIPAATQLFTPRWIVEYMVQNTLGKLWLQNKPNSTLRQHMGYYIESPSNQLKDYLKVGSVEEIKLLDQACGSGHILVYGFELLTRIYEEEGYNNSDIPQLIIEKNLYGFEIDERAAQLAGMALMMKARGYHRRFFKKEIKPNILCFKDLKLIEKEVVDTFNQTSVTFSDELQGDLKNMLQATNFGSLIRPKANIKEIEKVLNTFILKEATVDLFLKHNIVEIIAALKQLKLLATSFHCVVDNPPYMGGGKMNNELSTFVKTNYPEGKADLSSCFMISAMSMSRDSSLIGMVTLDSWMFLTSFEKVRELILKYSSVSSMLHVGWNCFPQGHVYNRGTAFVFIKNVFTEGTFINLSNVPATVNKKDLLKERLSDKTNTYVIDIRTFKKIPGYSFGYWLNENTIGKLQSADTLSKYGKAMKGLDTCDNDRFVRFWYEVNYDNLSLESGTTRKWYIYQKGGDFRKWYGNIEKIVNWKDNGLELKNFRNPDGSQKSRPQNVANYFKDGITWSAVGSGETSYRFLESSIFGGGGNGFFPDKQYHLFLLGYLNSKVAKYFLELFNPTINNLAGDLGKLPVEIENVAQIKSTVEEIIAISKKYWCSTEIYWGLSANELVNKNSTEIEDAYNLYQHYWRNKYLQIHKKEELLNLEFIQLYSLQNELNEKIPFENVTILKDEVSVTNGELAFHKDEIFKQFISYSVGCFFGRYSLHKEGLIISSQREGIENYLLKVGKSRSELNFLPDEDNVIPVLDDEWFEDDIVSRFHEFLKASFGEKHFRKNLAFVEECLGKGIRQYFTKDFYKDHVQRYKKRPIFWMFSSPNGYFNVLIYMHRYTSDTLNIILNSYLREFIEKLELQRKQMLNQEASGSATEQNKARKQIDKIDAMLADCRQYEVEILYPLASERIEIDLDDGVLVNYNKFGKAIALVDGLNDAKTKKKVREFDWIDTTKIK